MTKKIDSKILTNIVRNFHLDIDVSTQKWIILSLLSVSRTLSECIKIIEKYKGANNILYSIFKENLSFYKNSINNKKKTIGVWFDECTIGGQLLPYANRLKQEYNYNSIVLISANIFNNNNNSKIIEDLSNENFFFLPNDEVMAELTFINAIIFNEGYRYKTYLPKNVIRLAQPHGLDISYKKTIERYGGGSIFNYILAPMIEKYEDKNKYRGFFPSQMIEHSSEFVCVIPLGYPKLDLLIDRFKKVKTMKPKIIYHLSNIGLEKKAVFLNIKKTIHYLLESFQNYEIIFRPFPGDHENQIILNEISTFKENERFKISTSSSYINDYAGADFLVSHRVSTAQTFAFATGKPIIYFPLDNSNLEFEEHKLGYLVYNHKDLIKIGKKIESCRNQECDRIIKYRDKTICNPGRSLDCLVENLPYILDNFKNEDWIYFPLYDRTRNISREKEYEKRILYAVNSNRPFENMARSAECNYPDNLIFKYYFILSLLQYRASENSKYYYYRWYEAISILTKTLNNSCINNNIKRKLLLLSSERGIEVAKELKLYLNNNIQCYGDDIDQLIIKLEEFNSGLANITILYLKIKKKIITIYKAKLYKIIKKILKKARLEGWT